MSKTWLLRGLILLPLFGAACSTSKIPLYPADGTVFFKGKPASGAIVWLHPVGNTDPAALRPRGRADKDGVFHLGTFDTKDGAPAGKYLVSVYWCETKAGDVEGKSLLPAKYQNPNESGLPMIEIKEDTNHLPALQLTQ